MHRGKKMDEWYDRPSELSITSLVYCSLQAKWKWVQKRGITEPKSKVSAILLGRTTSQHKITFQFRLMSNHARRDRKLCPCHWDAGEKCKYPSPKRTPHMHPGVPSIAPHLRVSILCQSCLFNTTLILFYFFPSSTSRRPVRLAERIYCCPMWFGKA